MASQGFQPSPLPPIVETGMRGFFKWYAREQPYHYPTIAKSAWRNAPELFSDYVQSRAQVIRAAAGNASLLRRTYDPTVGAGLPNTRPVFHGLGQAMDQSDIQYTLPYAPDPSLISMNTGTDDTTLNQAVPTNISTSDAANAGAGTSTTSTAWLSSLIGAVGNAFTTAQQANTARAITNLQLQRAQAGLSPLNIGMSANGLPIIGSGGLASLFSGTGLLLVGGALAAWLFLRRKHA